MRAFASASAIIPLLLIGASSVCGQDSSEIMLPAPPPLKMPDWLAPFPQARDQNAKATFKEATATYKALGPATAVIARYEQQMRAAGIAFQTRQGGGYTSIETEANAPYGSIRVRQETDGAEVEVTYALRREPPPDAPQARALPPLVWEWPDWLEVSGGRLISQRTNPRGRVGKGSEDTCPGDVIAKPSQGCLKRVYESSEDLNDAYEEMVSLLEAHGYTTESASKEPYANLQLGKSIGDVFAQMTMRQYPAPSDPNYYAQMNVFLRRPPQATSTQVEITYMLKGGH